MRRRLNEPCVKRCEMANIFLSLLLFGVFLLTAGCRENPTVTEQQPEISTPTPTPDGFPARVVSISDGDTLTVSNEKNEQRRIRLATIDAPEYNQAFGRESALNLRSMVFKKNVWVVPEYHDKYGRLIAIVMFDGADINLEQIKKGCAWHYKQHAHEQSSENQQLYAEAEDAARESKVGLWARPNPVPPWDFRDTEQSKPFPRDGAKPIRNPGN